MAKQQVPDIDFDSFALGEIKDLFDTGKIYINPDYQRGDIWKHNQQIELIKSIENRYSIGVLVLFVNDQGRFEILDGQQRLLAIQKYLDGYLDLKDTEIVSYSELGKKEKILMDAYCIYYLKLKSHDTESKEEDILQIFLRLQEGTPLNKAEKISAHRGAFKEAFRNAREKHKMFSLMNGDKRFRLRLLAAEMLLIELESDFKNKIFPSLELKSFVNVLKKHEKQISPAKLKFYNGNLDLLHNSLNYLLTALTPREILTFYLLVSYLRKHRAGNEKLTDEMSAFAKEFLKKLNSFGIYDRKPPRGMDKDTFDKYRSYKFEAKVMTTPESIKKRFEIVLDEFNKMIPLIEKDPDRYHDEEQKRVLYFKQAGLCALCGMPMNFKDSSSDHVVKHSKGGKTKNINEAQLLHLKCHKRVEKSRIKHGTSS